MLVSGGERLRAIVTDFGLARATREDNRERSLTRSGAAIGTVAYMAPEQIKGEPVKAAADIYAFGVVMYEMVTGRCPFAGDSDLIVALKHVNEEPQPPRTLAPHLHPKWEKVILRCLKKVPEERFPSAAAVKAALREDRSDNRLISRRRIAMALPTALILVVLAIGVLVGAYRHWIAFKLKLLPSQKRLAVLEFANLGGDPANRAFCEGLMEAFTSKLTGLEEPGASLSVVPASDVRKEKVTSVRDARREFGANLVITGSVQRSASGLRLIINVVDADDLRQLRSREIFIPQTDVIAMQEGVLKQVADVLDLDIRPDAERNLNQGITRVPGAYEFYLQGTGYLLAGHAIDLAIAEFERALDLDPQYALAHAGLGEAYWGKYLGTSDREWVDEAWKECRQAIKLSPNLAAAHVTLAELNSGTGRYEEAIRQARRAIDIDPGSYQAHSELARALDAIGRTDEAERTLKKAIALQPNYWRSYVELGTFYYNHDRNRDAEVAYRRVTELVPDNPTGYTDLAVIYHLEGRETEAEQMLKRSLQLRPTPQAYSNLATIYFFQSRYADAVPILEKLVATGSKDYVVWANLGDAYRWTPGEEHKAAQAYRTAMRLAGQALQVNALDAGALMTVALCRVKLGEVAQAVAALKKALATARADSNLLFNAAIVYELANKRASAIKYLGMAIRAGYALNEVAAEPELRALRLDPRYATIQRSSSDLKPNAHLSKEK